AALNKVEDRIVICEGDNRLVCPRGVATRVNMGLIPTSLASLETACQALDVTAATELTLHVHENLSYIDTKQQECDVPKKMNKDQVETARTQWAAGIVAQVREV